MIWKKGQEVTAAYYNRTREREKTLMNATMNLLLYFIGLDESGDDDAAKKASAELKVSQISTEVAPLLYVYTLGNTAPLIAAINASALSFMDAAAKVKLTGDLTL